jgi:YfiR/HmsC-like
VQSNSIIAPRLLCMWQTLRTGFLQAWCAALVLFSPASAMEQPEYRLKAAFLYNFAVFTEWPADTGPALSFCVVGMDPFGKEIDALAGETAAGRPIAIHRKRADEPLKACHLVFVSASAIGVLPKLLEELAERPVLTVADTPGAAKMGVMLNLSIRQNKVSFEANLAAARRAKVVLGSRLLRLTTEVIQ